MRSADVLRIENGGLTGKKVKAPVPDSWFGTPSTAIFMPSPTYGFMCPLLQAGLSTP